MFIRRFLYLDPGHCLGNVLRYAMLRLRFKGKPPMAAEKPTFVITGKNFVITNPEAPGRCAASFGAGLNSRVFLMRCPAMTMPLITGFIRKLYR
jgi:hypothetical protein